MYIHCVGGITKISLINSGSLARVYSYLGLLEQERQCWQRLWPLKLGQTSLIFPCQALHLRFTSLRRFCDFIIMIKTNYNLYFSMQWFGEGEKYVKAVFTLASKIAPSVVFVDEVCFLTIMQCSSKCCFYLTNLQNQYPIG